MSLTRKPPPPRREAKQSSYRPTMQPAAAVIRRVDTAQPTVAPAQPRRQAAVRATPAEREHMGRVKRLACVLCRRLSFTQESATEVHHVREDQGAAQRASNFLVAALCGERCHRGPNGIHGDRSLLRFAKCTELDLLAWTLADLAESRELMTETA